MASQFQHEHITSARLAESLKKLRVQHSLAESAWTELTKIQKKHIVYLNRRITELQSAYLGALAIQIQLSPKEKK